ncbi:hypothetical protein BaRGS_00015036, partial [Batillaria attramentaria]
SKCSGTTLQNKTPSLTLQNTLLDSRLHEYTARSTERFLLLPHTVVPLTKQEVLLSPQSRDQYDGEGWIARRNTNGATMDVCLAFSYLIHCVVCFTLSLNLTVALSLASQHGLVETTSVLNLTVVLSLASQHGLVETTSALNLTVALSLASQHGLVETTSALNLTVALSLASQHGLVETTSALNLTVALYPKCDAKNHSVSTVVEV